MTDLDVRWEQGIPYRVDGGFIGVIAFSDPASDGLPARVFLAGKYPDGREWSGGLGVGEEFLVGSSVCRVRSIEGTDGDEPGAWAERVGAAEESAPGEWEYFLVNRTYGPPEEEGKVVRVRRGDPLERGFVATPWGEWSPTDAVDVVGREPGTAEPISELRARALLTDRVRARRFRRLPEGLPTLGPPISAKPWDYFLVSPQDPDLAADVDGELLRHRPGASAGEASVLNAAGQWSSSLLLQRLWAERGAERAVFPIGERVARWLATVWVARGRLDLLPSGFSPSRPPWRPRVEQGWEYFLVRHWWEREEDLASGRVVRHLVGTSYWDGHAAGRSGAWEEELSLFPLLVLGERSEAVRPLPEDEARRLLTWRLAHGLVTALPEGIEPLED